MTNDCEGFSEEVIESWIHDCCHSTEWLAECLQRLARFGGQHPTSNVLRHVLEVRWRLRYASDEVQLWALHHDDHELLTGEITRPAKVYCPQLLEMQSVLDNKPMNRLGLRNNSTPANQATVYAIDKAIGEEEFARWQDFVWEAQVNGDPVKEFVRLDEELRLRLGHER